jgi:hypothetical protein
MSQRFSAALEAFDIELAKTPLTHAYIKSGLRDTSNDRFKDYSPAEIVSAESKNLKSAGRASEVCSVLTAYRLLDVMYALEHPDNGVKAPQHQRLQANFASFKVTMFFFFRLQCHDIDLDIYLDYKATRRLDVSCEELSQAVQKPKAYECYTDYIRGSCFSRTLRPV